MVSKRVISLQDLVKSMALALQDLQTFCQELVISSGKGQGRVQGRNLKRSVSRFGESNLS